MDTTNGYDPTLPMDLEGSVNPDLLTEVTFGSHLEYPDGSVPMFAKTSNGRMSPVRARTMKEYDQQIAVLKKENFSLKLRIYFLEERMQQKFGDGEDVFKTNIELKVECESLKRELADKHNLLKKASNAMENLSSNHQSEMAKIQAQVERDFKDSNNGLAYQLDSAQKAHFEAEEALQDSKDKIQELQGQLDKMATEVKEVQQKGDDYVKDLMQELKDKNNEIEHLTATNLKNQDDIDLLQQQKDHAEDELEKLEKELGRKGRDLEQLSCIVRDTTLLDSQSFLLNNHLQDAVDDQNEAVKNMEEKVKDGELKIKDKNETIGKLEDLLKSVEANRKEKEKTLQDAEDKLLQERTKAALRDKTIKGLHSVITTKAKEMEALAEKLKVRDEEMKAMQEEFQDTAVQRQKELDRQHEENNFLEQKEASMKVRLAEQENELEKLMRSLGRKEGELEGFKDLLSKAQNALQQSEDAVEVLQDQLKKERVPSHPSSAHSSPVKHYKDLLDESQKRVSEKDSMIHQLNDTLRDKDKQLRTCMGIFDTPQDAVSGEMVDKLTRQLKESDRALARLLEERALVIAEKEKKLEELREVLSDKEADIARANKMLLAAEDTIDCLEKANKEKANSLQVATDMMRAAEQALQDAKQSFSQAMAEKDSIISRLQDSIGDKEALLKETMKRAPMTTDEVMDLKKTLQNKDRTLQDMIDEKDKTLTANAECVNSLLKKLQAREAELSQMSDKHKKDIANMEQETLKMSGDLRKVEMELRRKQNELHSADNQASRSHQQSQDVLDKLRAVISDKDKTISTLLDSVQEKDKVNGQLRHDLQSKDDLVDKLQTLLRQSQTGSSADLSAKLQELQIELAVKTEGLRNARRMEEDLREQIQELKQKLNSVPQGDREYHTLEKQIYYLKDKLEGQGWTPGGSSPGSPGGSSAGSNGQQVLLQETLQAQLEELRRLNAAVQTEQHLLESIRDKSQGSDHSQAVDEELTAVRTLRRELEEGVQHNHQMRTILEGQMKGISTKESSQENVDDLRKTLNFLKLELETSKLNNRLLQSKNDLQPRQRVDGEGRAESYHQGAQTSPVAATWSPGKNRSPSPIDVNVQLNRQTLSDMSAPMLRKLIRQLQQQLSQEEKENAELRRKLSVMEDVRNIPGKNDDDENSIPYLRSEIERLEREVIRKEEMIGELQVRLGSQERDSSAGGVTDLKNEVKKLTLQLNHTQEVISMLKQQLILNAQSKGSDFDPELIVQMAGEIQKLKLECDKARRGGSTSSDTSEVCSSVSAPSLIGDGSLKGRSLKKSSQIPRPRIGSTPVVGDISSINQPETLKTLLMESKKRITDLEDKLKATEGTVRYQTQKMKYYKGLLEDNGLIQRSPMCSRSSSESNLAALFSKIPVRKRTASQEHLPSVVGSMDSAIGSDYGGAMDTVFERFGKTDDKETLKDQVTQLRELLVRQSRDIKALRDKSEKEKQQRPTDRLDQNAQTLHSLDDTLVSRHTLQDLYQQMETLQRNLQETQDTNAELQHKLLQLQHHNADTLQLQLKDSQAQTAVLEEKIAAFQNSSVHEILEAQKSELVMLRKKFSDTQNSCTQLNYWLEEVSTFLTELVYVDEDGDRNQVRGMKHKVDMSKTIVRNMSTCILDSFDASYDVTSDQPQTDESKGLVAENEALRRSETNLTEGLRQKNLEVEKLTNELRKKNMLVDQLHQELLHFHQMNRKSESPKSSSTVSSADGNVTPSGKMSKGTHELSNRSPSNSQISEQVSQVSSLRSPERMRHMTGSSFTDGSHLRLDKTQEGVVIVEDVADSSQGSTGYHSSHLSGDDFMQGPGHLHSTTESDKENSSIYISAFDTDEKLMYNRRLADGQMFDNTLTPPVFKLNGDTSLPTKIAKATDGRHVEFSILDKSEREEGEVESLRARLSAVEDLNKTLKDELNVYENLCTSIGVQNSPTKMSPCSKSKQETDTDLLRQHLSELRALRIKLEHSVTDSDRLRHQLELDMDGHKITTDSTQNVYMYSKQQTTITELQQTIRLLQQQLKENQSTVRDKIITIQEREWTIQKLQQELSDTKQQHTRSPNIKTQTPEKDVSIREWHENVRSQEQTCVLQQRRIEQQDNLLEQLRKKLQLQEHSLHQQETKLKEMYESAGQQKDQDMHDKDNMILRRGKQIAQLEQSTERLEKKISQLEDCIKKQEEQVKQKESCIKTMKGELQKQEDTIQHQGDVVKQREKVIRKLKDEVHKKVDIIKQQGETITDKETAMKSLSRVVHEQADHMRNKDNTLLKYDKEVRSLNEKVKQLDQLKAEKDEANNRLVQRNEILDQDNCKLVARNEELDSQLKHSSKEVDRLKQEMETMLEKAQENQDLNKTLKLELSVYEKLQSEDSSSKPLGGFDIRELLTEIRHLRVQLERCIDTNNALRQKLEEHLLHQASPQQVTTTTTNYFTVKDGSPTRSNGTDVPDGQPNPERPYVNGALTIRRVQSHQVPMGSRSASGSFASNSSDTMSVSCPSDTPSLSGFGISTWPPMSSENVMFSQQRELCVSQSSPGGTLHQSLVDLAKLGYNSRPVMSEGNLSYYVDDPPSSVADLTGIKIDSDLRCLFAVGKLDDYEKLKKENCESLTVLKGIEARIKERLRVFKTMRTSESVEYSTLKELSLSSENLRICLDEEKSLIGCFWTTQLPKGGSDAKVTAENKLLRAELFTIQSKYELMVKMVQDAETRLHTSNKQKQSMEEIIHRQLKKTTKVVAKARTNFEKDVPSNSSGQLVSITRGQPLRDVDTDSEISYS
ncbi:myomegalin-like isoform X3 [Mizuhopecten yessoensis]|uniref:myomegalin-like isoform X3 n=1 Tax=Mizuhopecten yessoensis TaxID=6573 RepID=UPI000B45D960|nr:myomegalin-like isoform X3 [Mizuhopecten yessoensis]